jgi:hypothetical protein
LSRKTMPFSTPSYSSQTADSVSISLAMPRCAIAVLRLVSGLNWPYRGAVGLRRKLRQH